MFDCVIDETDCRCACHRDPDIYHCFPCCDKPKARHCDHCRGTGFDGHYPAPAWQWPDTQFGSLPPCPTCQGTGIQ